MRIGWIVIAFVAGALLGAVGGTALPTRGQATLLSYELAPEGQQEIRVLVGVSRLTSFNFVDVQEDANAVRISVDVLQWRGTAPADMKLLYVPVALQQPLRTRSVLNSSGQPIPLRKRAAAPAQTSSPRGTAVPSALLGQGNAAEHAGDRSARAAGARPSART
jgi:hypothetical protein